MQDVEAMYINMLKAAKKLVARKGRTIADLQSKLEKAKLENAQLKAQLAAAVQPEPGASQLAGGGDESGVVALLKEQLAAKSEENKQHVQVIAKLEVKLEQQAKS